jgi:hypothetical protein
MDGKRCDLWHTVPVISNNDQTQSSGYAQVRCVGFADCYQQLA